MNEPKITTNVMPGAQMNGYVKEQHNYFGTVQQISSNEAQKGTEDAEEAEVGEEVKKVAERTGREKAIEFAKDLLTDLNLSLDAVAKYSRLPLPDVEELAKSMGK